MPDYKAMYYKLFNAATDAEELIRGGLGLIGLSRDGVCVSRALEAFEEAHRLLILSQQETEEMYIDDKQKIAETAAGKV